MSRLEQYRARQAERIEAMNNAIDEGRTSVVSSAAPAEDSPRRHYVHVKAYRRFKAKPIAPPDFDIKRTDSGVWVGSRKSATATSVETLFRQPLDIFAAALIGRESSHAEPMDGELFAYDARTRQMIPVESQGVTVKRAQGIVRKRPRQYRSKNQITGNAVLKAK